MKLSRTLIRLIPIFFAVVPLRAEEPFHLVMQMDLPVKNAQFAGLLLAEQKGWYKDAGLDVMIVSAQAGLDVAKKVGAADNVVGSIESGLFLSGRAEGLPVVAVGTMFQASPLCLISFTNKQIRTPKDLAGKHVVVHADGYEALDTVLNKAGLTRARLKVEEADYGNDVLLSGRYDAQQGYTVDEFVALQTEGREVSALALRDFGHLAYSQVYFVSEAFLKNHRAELVKFIAVSSRGWRAALADVPGAARMIIEKYEPSLAFAYQTESLKEIGKLLWAESPQTGAMRPETWSVNTASFLRSNPRAKLPPMAAWADFKVVAEAGADAAP
jgi:ABC-type nitrate/sulfonate/bicarbonate transport system substrate-binding protein